MGVGAVWMGIEQQVATKNWEWVRELSSARYTSICSSSFPILYTRPALCTPHVRAHTHTSIYIYIYVYRSARTIHTHRYTEKESEPVINPPAFKVIFLKRNCPNRRRRVVMSFRFYLLLLSSSLSFSSFLSMWKRVHFLRFPLSRSLPLSSAYTGMPRRDIPHRSFGGFLPPSDFRSVSLLLSSSFPRRFPLYIYIHCVHVPTCAWVCAFMCACSSFSFVFFPRLIFRGPRECFLSITFCAFPALSSAYCRTFVSPACAAPRSYIIMSASRALRDCPRRYYGLSVVCLEACLRWAPESGWRGSDWIPNERRVTETSGWSWFEFFLKCFDTNV